MKRASAGVETTWKQTARDASAGGARSAGLLRPHRRRYNRRSHMDQPWPHLRHRRLRCLWFPGRCLRRRPLRLRRFCVCSSTLSQILMHTGLERRHHRAPSQARRQLSRRCRRKKGSDRLRFYSPLRGLYRRLFSSMQCASGGTGGAACADATDRSVETHSKVNRSRVSSIRVPLLPYVYCTAV